MRTVLVAVAFSLPATAFAQTKDIAEAVEARLAPLRFVASLRDPASGGYRPDPMGEPSLRATGAAARAWKYLGGDAPRSAFPGRARAAAFVAACYDPKTGGFADAPGGAPDAATTALGAMAAVEFGVPKEKFAGAMTYLKDNAKTFEDVRIGAAAVEAWGVKDCPFPLDAWLEIADTALAADRGPAVGGRARLTGSVAAMCLRLGKDLPDRKRIADVLDAGQRPDGGWGEAVAEGSDLESTYRVMRAYRLLRKKPKDAAKLREFLAGCRNADGGYGAAPKAASNVGGVYRAAIVGHWLDEMARE